LSASTAKVGATYEWQWRNEQPSESSKQTLLETFVRLTGIEQVLTLDHSAGIRPTTRDKHPFIGFHPLQKQLAIFNGFGSKGALLIPYFAFRFVEALLCDKPLPSDADIDRFAQGNSLVTLAKRFISEHVNPGDTVIDATVGNGYDTEYLARCVGAEGHVYGFDIQQQSIANTNARLRVFGLERRVTLFHAGHDSMVEHIEDRLHGQIAAIMFNLGYLPGGDKSIQTQTDSTLKALKQALTLLQAGGIITVVTYSGHAGGDYEAREVSNWLKQSGNESVNVEFVSPGTHTSNAPGLIRVIKK
ncbi:FAD-dependent oxidoreductase, partial [Kaarinaea lacus]